MATGPKGVCRELKTLFHLGVVGTLSDAQLLEEFLASRGDAAEDAFAAVVERHGPMVLRVCRRILTEPHDAEDAFQVTFLVLARKARTIARREQLTNWLYGVAVRTAKEVRKSSARRRAREGRVDEMVRTASPREEDIDELRLVIDDELSRLPESFRAPVVLCDLEGKTQKEAAQLLGVPVGTVSSRLSRGRNLLRQRLTRRGLAPPGTELATEPFRDETPTAVPPALVACTSRAAAQFVVQGTLAGTVAAHLATITEGVLKAMLIAKLTSKGIVVSAILFLSIGAAAVGVVASQYSGSRPLGRMNGRIGPGAPTTTPEPPAEQHVDGTPRVARDTVRQDPTLRNKIVSFGESSPDVPDTYLIRAWDPDGGATTTIAGFPGHTWTGRVSRDGRRIAFMLPPLQISGDKGIHLWVMDAVGRNREMLVEDAAGTVSCWSPDGSQVVFYRPVRKNNPPAFQNFLVDLATKKVVALNLAGNEIISDWSPDGQEWLIATLGTPPDPRPEQFQIYRVKRDGSERVRLGDLDTGNSAARFSHKGQRILYLTGAPRPTERRKPSVRVMGRDGSQIRTVLEGEAGQVSGHITPCWSLDGRSIAVLSQEITGDVIIIVDPEGRAPARRLPMPNRHIAAIDWP